MSTLHIYVDSSTKGANGRKWGESVAAWMSRWDKATLYANGGVHYMSDSGPNRTFYVGIIHALEGALPDVNYGSGDPIRVYGDCQLVIHQLQGTVGVDKLRDCFDRVQALESQITKGVTYHYLNETDTTYKKVDILSKRGRGLFREAMK